MTGGVPKNDAPLEPNRTWFTVMFAMGAALETLINLEVAGLPDSPCAPFGIVTFSFEVSYYGRR